MPLVKTIQIDAVSKIGIWHIAEPETFFQQSVHISRLIHHPHKRLQHFAARYLLKELFPNFPVSDIQIAPSRKPFLKNNHFYFSIAHSGEYAAAIVSERHQVGIDIEYSQPAIGKVAHKFLGVDEQTFIDQSDPLLHQTVCWTAKEAVYKWYGKGDIDFKKNIHLRPFPLKIFGDLECDFNKESLSAELTIHYELSAGYCVAWLCAD